MYTLRLCEYGTEPIILVKYNHRITRPPPLHAHDFVEIFYIEAGVGLHWIGGEEYEVRKGDLGILNTWLAHTYFPYEDNDLVVLNCLIDPQILEDKITYKKDESIESLFFTHYLTNKIYDKNADFKLKGKDTESIGNILDQMHVEYEAKSYNYVKVLEDYLEILLYKIMRLYADQSNNSINKHARIISNLMTHIKNHLTNQFSVSELASSYSISPKYLSRLFKKYTGHTILKYMHKLRIEKAMHILFTSDVCIRDIANEVGYNDITFFYNLFKRYTGLKPGDFKRRITSKLLVD